MNPRELRRAMKERKAELRAQLAARRKQVRARLPEAIERRRRSRKRRRRLLILAALVILYLLLRNCECAPPPEPGLPDLGAPPPADLGVDAGEPAKKPKPPKMSPPKKRKRRFTGKIKPRVRPSYESESPPPDHWLHAFRLQVGARSPRLARCFEGTDRPGALKWTTSVDIARGLVSDHSFDTVLAGATLSKDLRACLIDALARPPYRLPKEQAQTTPSRVSMVIEF